MLISQIKDASGNITVAVREEGGEARAVKGAESVYALAMEAANGGKNLADVISAHGLGDAVDLEKAYAEGRFLPPITHPDPAHLHLTGTGLTHLGSAATRDSMHKKTTEAAEESLTDSMKMFRMGLENGKPKAGERAFSPSGSTRATAMWRQRPVRRSPRLRLRWMAAKSLRWQAST